MGEPPRVESTPIHIFRLPVEVLQYISEQATLYLFDDHPFEPSRSLDKSRLTLSSVCSWWRAIVVNHPVLWASILYANSGPPTPLEWIWLCLRRSAPHDLHLAIHFCVDYHDLQLRYIIYPSVWEDGPAISRLISFLDTIEDDMDRVCRLSICTFDPDNLHKLIIPKIRLANLTNLRGLLLTTGGNPCRAIGAMALSRLDQLELCVPTIHRTSLASLLARCHSLRHLSLQIFSKKCSLGGSASPALHVPHLQSLNLRGCVMPAHAFHAPELKRLLISPSMTWWEADGPIAEITDHHEEVVDFGHFPQLHQLVVGTWYRDMEYLEPSIRLIQAHPDIGGLTLHGQGAGDLLRSAFQPFPHSHTAIYPSMNEGGAAPENGTEWELQVPTALRSLVVNSLLGFKDATLAKALRHMLLDSDILHVKFLLRFFEDRNSTWVEYNTDDYADYISLLTEFPGRFSIGTLPLVGSLDSLVECR